MMKKVKKNNMKIERLGKISRLLEKPVVKMRNGAKSQRVSSSAGPCTWSVVTGLCRGNLFTLRRCGPSKILKNMPTTGYDVLYAWKLLSLFSSSSFSKIESEIPGVLVYLRCVASNVALHRRAYVSCFFRGSVPEMSFASRF